MSSAFRSFLRSQSRLFFSPYSASSPRASTFHRCFHSAYRHRSQQAYESFSAFRRAFSSSSSSSSSSASSSSSSSFSSFLRQLYASYSSLLERFPYSTQMATSGFLGGAGDATTQWFEHRWDLQDGRQPKPWDLRRLFAVSFFGVYFMGPVGHVWYERLDSFCHRYARRAWQMLSVKIIGDTFVFGPVCLWAFFVSVSLMEGISWRHTEQKIRRDFVPTYLVDYSIWPLVQGINFRYVPVQHQLLVVNLLCYFDDIFLSYVQHNSLPALFQAIEDWWERQLASRGWDSDLHELQTLEEQDDRRRKELFRRRKEEEQQSADAAAAAEAARRNEGRLLQATMPAVVAMEGETVSTAAAATPASSSSS